MSETESMTTIPSDSRPIVRPLKVCILAAGYGTRLERDIKEEQTGRFRHLIGVPKPLVPIGGVTLLTRWIRLLQTAQIALTDIFIIGNQYNHEMLQVWSKESGLPSTNIVNDGSTNNETRLGAVRDLDVLLQQLKFDPQMSDWRGLLIIGGDTLFYPDFSLPTLIEEFDHSKRNLILYYSVTDTRKNGILEVNEEGLVTQFLEKPEPTVTESRKACPCFYLLTNQALSEIHSYVTQAKSLAEVDAPGNLIRHLIHRNSLTKDPTHIPIEAKEISGRFDIGGLESYIVCDRWFTKQSYSESEEE